MIKIFLFNIQNIGKGQLCKKFSLLSEFERNRAKRFKFENDFKRYLVGKLMAKNVIGRRFNVRPKDVGFSIDKYDRPHLKYPEIKNFDFNISHSDDYVALALSDARVGIDVEKIRPTDLSVAHECFHDKELKYLYGDKDKTPENFFKLWTLKESFIKAIGRGLSCPLKDFYFTILTDQIRLNILPGKKIDNNWNFQTYNFEPGYILAVCSKHNKLPEKIEIVYESRGLGG